jgi:hypothetical protein
MNRYRITLTEGSDGLGNLLPLFSIHDPEQTVASGLATTRKRGGRGKEKDPKRRTRQGHPHTQLGGWAIPTGKSGHLIVLSNFF